MSTDPNALPPEDQTPTTQGPPPAQDASAKEPAPEPDALAAPPADESSLSETSESPRRRIKIGSQRDTVPHPQTRRQPPRKPNEAAPLEPPVLESPTQPQAAETRQGEPKETTAAATTLAPSEPASPPPPALDAAETAPAAQESAAVGATEEQWAAAAALEPEMSLDDEVAAAMGDVSLDEMLAGEESFTGEEAELDSQRRATVVHIHRDNVFFSLGQRSEGVASLKQFPEPPEVGATMDVVLVRFDQEEGLYEVRVAGASVVVGDWSDVAEGVVVEARITGHNKGGLECAVNHIRGFIPASQISLYRVEDLSQFVDQKLVCLVIEANPHKRNLVLSRKAILEREQEEARERLLDELEVGQVREGVVRSLRDFGAFVDLGGVDGMIHISQLSWDRVGHPSEVLN